MNEIENVTVASIASIQEIATRALAIACGEEIAGRTNAQMAEDVSVRIAKAMNLQGGQR